MQSYCIFSIALVFITLMDPKEALLENIVPYGAQGLYSIHLNTKGYHLPVE